MFSELKVIDISTVLAGPSVGTFFSELGATVIKIESPFHGDVTRSWKLSSEDPSSKISAYFSSVNYKKRYIKLDFSLEEDHNVLLNLVKDADILLSNFKYGDAEKFKLTDAVLTSLNPRLIHGKISGFGQNSDRVAYDLILQAETGFMSMNGSETSDPTKMPVALIDILAAHHLKEGILVALLERTRTGKGKNVSISLYEAAIASLVNQATNYLMGGQIAKRQGSLHPNIAPYGEIFKTKDNQLITFAIGSDTHFVKLCNYLNLSDFTKDARFNMNVNRVKNRKQLYTLLQNEIKEKNCKDILDYMLNNHVPAGKIKTIDEVLEDPNCQHLILTETIEGVETKRIASVLF